MVKRSPDGFLAAVSLPGPLEERREGFQLALKHPFFPQNPRESEWGIERAHEGVPKLVMRRFADSQARLAILGSLRSVLVEPAPPRDLLNAVDRFGIHLVTRGALIARFPAGEDEARARRFAHAGWYMGHLVRAKMAHLFGPRAVEYLTERAKKSEGRGTPALTPASLAHSLETVAQDRAIPREHQEYLRAAARRLRAPG
jgi:hypothetical protein